MNYQWKILEVFAKDEIITGAKYHLTGSDEEFSVETEGYYYFNEPTIKVAFADVTEQMISEWIDEEAIRDGKNHIKLGLENQINALKAHKPVVAPWLVEDTFTI